MSDPITITSSYDPEDVTFLLKPVELPPTPIAEKERRIQNEEMHYSEMISVERRPDARYLEIFEAAFARHRDRIAREIASLARQLALETPMSTTPIVLCSLVRAGVPYGVLLRRALQRIRGNVHHYAVSIIRDRGLDRVAMDHIRTNLPNGRIVFVDGWTGKGAIANELTRSWRGISGQTPDLVTLADPSGFASLAASHEDWLIPSGILGANVSGLVSRSILNDQVIGEGEFHGAVPVPGLAEIDNTRRYVDEVTERMRPYLQTIHPAQRNAVDCALLRERAGTCVAQIADRYRIDNLNRIKPGIAEATRAILRRRPWKVFLREAQNPDLEGIQHLCRVDAIDVEVSPDLTGPYRAITLIEKTSP